MTREVISVAPDCTLDEGIRLFESCRFRHLPVTEKGELVGMISDRDIALSTGWILASYRHAEESSGPQTVREVMREEIRHLAPESTVNQVAALMLDNRVGAVPMVEGAELVGIVTTTDLLRACMSGSPGFDWKIPADERVERAMSRDVRTIGPDALMADAIDLCKEDSVRHLPVVENGKLIGMLSDRDIRFGLGQEIVSDLLAQEEGRLEVPRTPVSALMTTEVVTIGPDELLTTAAESLLEHNFSALAVQKSGSLEGIVTQTDILRSCC